jgi:hypothetical protein
MYSRQLMRLSHASHGGDSWWSKLNQIDTVCNVKVDALEPHYGTAHLALHRRVNAAREGTAQRRKETLQFL